MIAVVTGGRCHVVTASEAADFSQSLTEHGITTVREGGARGVDAWVSTFCRAFPEIKVETWLALWKSHGKAAGCIRNVNMLVGPPRADIVFAFPGGRGTAHCVSAARRRWIRVVEIGR